jgi:aquaporin Z
MCDLAGGYAGGQQSFRARTFVTSCNKANRIVQVRRMKLTETILAIAPEATGATPARSRPQVSIRSHWREYGMEGALLGCFMISACFFGILYEFPGSPVRQAIESDALRRVLMGLSMGLTAIFIIYSPWGKQSGAHINPAITLTYYRLGKIPLGDALFYMAAQFTGAVAGVALVTVFLREMLIDPHVRFVATQPGPSGVIIAVAAEFVIAFMLMSAVLYFSSVSRISRFTGIAAGCLVATYISLESPLSGMSMNPARTFGSAFWAGIFENLWIYFVVPPLAMLAAAEVRLRFLGGRSIGCCKLHHDNPRRCIFCGANGGHDL